MGTNMQDIQFLSTLSLRRATIPFVQFLLHTPISIHALLAESDRFGRVTAAFCLHFYPRSPCGERPVNMDALCVAVLISIHALLAESDCTSTAQSAALPPISIHALLAESDHTFVRPPGNSCNFYPRSPCGERQHPPAGRCPAHYFYPRSPCGERQEGQA